MYYSIDDSNGINLCGGISELRIAQVAQEEADRTGAAVLVYSSDGEEEYFVEPTELTVDDTADCDAEERGEQETEARREDI